MKGFLASGALLSKDTFFSHFQTPSSQQQQQQQRNASNAINSLTELFVSLSVYLICIAVSVYLCVWALVFLNINSYTINVVVHYRYGRDLSTHSVTWTYIYIYIEHKIAQICVKVLLIYSLFFVHIPTSFPFELKSSINKSHFKELTRKRRLCCFYTESKWNILNSIKGKSDNKKKS